MKGFPVVLPHPGKPEENDVGAPVEVGIWTPGESDIPAVWHSGTIKFDYAPKAAVFEMPSCALLTDDSLYIGLNTGVVKKIAVATAEAETFDRIVVDDIVKQWDLFGSRQAYERHQQTFPRVKELAEKNPDDKNLQRIVAEAESKDRIPKFLRIDPIIGGGRAIKRIVEHEGVVYDAGPTGLYRTDTGKPLYTDFLHSAVVVNGMLCYVPVHQAFTKILDGDGEPEDIENRGSLVNALTGEVVMKKISPADGSGGKMGTYCISGGKAYIHHGNWPCEAITIRSFPEVAEEEPTRMRIPTSRRFVAHKGVVYDQRMIRQPRQEDEHVLIRSDVDFYSSSAAEQIIRFSPNECVTGMVDGGNLGILVSVYHSDDDRTTIVSHLDQKKMLLEMPGIVRLL